MAGPLTLLPSHRKVTAATKPSLSKRKKESISITRQWPLLKVSQNYRDPSYGGREGENQNKICKYINSRTGSNVKKQWRKRNLLQPQKKCKLKGSILKGSYFQSWCSLLFLFKWAWTVRGKHGCLHACFFWRTFRFFLLSVVSHHPTSTNSIIYWIRNKSSTSSSRKSVNTIKSGEHHSEKRIRSLALSSRRTQIAYQG